MTKVLIVITGFLTAFVFYLLLNETNEMKKMASEIDEINEFLGLAMDELYRADMLVLEFEAMLENACDSDQKGTEMCLNYESFISENPKVYATWVTPSEM